MHIKVAGVGAGASPLIALGWDTSVSKELGDSLGWVVRIQFQDPVGYRWGKFEALFAVCRSLVLQSSRGVMTIAYL